MSKSYSIKMLIIAALSATAFPLVAANSENTFADDVNNITGPLQDFSFKNAAKRQKLDRYFFGANRGGLRLFRGQGEALMNIKVDQNNNARSPYKNAFKPLIPDYYLHEDYKGMMKRFYNEYTSTIKSKVNLSNLWVGQSLDFGSGVGFAREPALSDGYTFTFLGHETTLKHVKSTKYADLAMWMGSGVSEIDGYLVRVLAENTRQLSSFKASEFCSPADLLEINWRQNKYIDNLHPAIAKVLAKTDVTSVHDYNLDLRRYLEGKELVVSDAATKNKLKAILANSGVNASVSVGKGLIPRTPIDDTYFSVKRSDEEMGNIYQDYWGYDSAVKELYSYRTFSINDVRLLKKGATMSDVLHQKVLKEKSIMECSLSL